jgi:hypothetical protein
MNRFLWISISELLVRGMVFGLTGELPLGLISVFVDGYT